MAIMAGLALAGAAFQTLGALQAQQEKKNLAKLRARELRDQAQTSQEIFDFNFSQLKKQNSLELGERASSLAKKGVALESGSALANLSEQARQNSLKEYTAIFQNNLEQRQIRMDQFLNKRTIKNVKTEQAFTLASGIVGGATSVAGAGGLS